MSRKISESHVCYTERIKMMWCGRNGVSSLVAWGCLHLSESDTSIPRGGYGTELGAKCSFGTWKKHQWESGDWDQEIKGPTEFHYHASHHYKQHQLIPSDNFLGKPWDPVNMYMLSSFPVLRGRGWGIHTQVLWISSCKTDGRDLLGTFHSSGQ